MSIVNRETTGVSPVVGVILLVAITVILSAVVGMAVFHLAPSGDDGSPSSAVSIDERADGIYVRVISTGSNNLTVLHNGAKIHEFTTDDIGALIRIEGVSPKDTITILENGTNKRVVTTVTARTSIGGSGVTVISGSGSSSEPITLSTLWFDGFEGAAAGNAPANWTIYNDGSTTTPVTSTTRNTEGSQALASTQSNTGSPSHHHTYQSVSFSQSKARFTFDVNVDFKENGGSANAVTFMLQNTSSHNSAKKTAFYLNFVQGGSSISVFENGSYKQLEATSFDTWYTTIIDVDFMTDTYTVTLNGVEYGPYQFRQAGTASDFTHLTIHNDNYYVYLDNVTVEG